MKHIFAALMYQFPAAQQTSSAKLTVVFLKFKEILHRLSVNKPKPDTTYASNWNNFVFGIKKRMKFYKRVMFWVSLQNLDYYLNPHATDNVDLNF